MRQHFSRSKNINKCASTALNGHIAYGIISITAVVMPVGVEYSLNNTEVLMINTVLRKRWFRSMYAVLVAALVFVLCMQPAAAAAEQYSITGKFYQSESRATLALINSFRQGDNAWHWNEDNATKTVKTGLCAMTYDYNLELIAMQRAAEIAVFYSHERPDGTPFYTVKVSSTTSSAENIAICTVASRRFMR